MPHFKDGFNQNSDVIYGTGLWIHIYLYNFYFGWPTSAPTSKDDIVQNPSNEKFPPKMSQAHDKYGTNVINVYNEPIGTKSFPVGTDKKVTPTLGSVATSHDTTTQGLASEYLKHLRDCKHLGPDSLTGEISERLIRSLKKYQKMESVDLTPSTLGKKLRSSVGYHLYDVCIRRSCKYGVFYFTHIKSATLHYILDEMDIATIVDKKMLVNDSTNAEKVPICTSELRYIFRHWNGLKDKSLLFYDQYQTCGAPWADVKWQNHREGWADYAIIRVGKYREQITKATGSALLLQAFDDAVRQFNLSRAAVNAAKVIDAFHALPVNLTNNPKDDTIPKD